MTANGPRKIQDRAAQRQAIAEVVARYEREGIDDHAMVAEVGRLNKETFDPPMGHFDLFRLMHAVHEEVLDAEDATGDDYAVGEAEATSWAPVDLSAVLAGGQPDERPTLLERSDGVALIYRKRLHSLVGEPESTKGWLALAAAAERVRAGGPVVYIDFEDSAANIAARLLALQLEPELIGKWFHYVRPDEPVSEDALETLLALESALVILDGVTEALALEGLDLASNQDVAEFFKRCARPFARAGAAVVLVDHVVKDKESRGRYAIGAQHKLAGVDVAYSVELLEPFGRGRAGKARLVVKKDRPGHIRGHADEHGTAAVAHLDSAADGTVRVTLTPADTSERNETFRPTNLMEKVSRALEQEPGLTRNAIRTAVGGSTRYVDLARELLVAEGHVEVRREGQAHLHFAVSPYREDHDRDSGTQSGLNQDPVPVLATGTPGPTPLRGVAVPVPVTGAVEDTNRDSTLMPPELATSHRSGASPYDPFLDAA